MVIAAVMLRHIHFACIARTVQCKFRIGRSCGATAGRIFAPILTSKCRLVYAVLILVRSFLCVVVLSAVTIDKGAKCQGERRRKVGSATPEGEEHSTQIPTTTL